MFAFETLNDQREWERIDRTPHSERTDAERKFYFGLLAEYRLATVTHNLKSMLGIPPARNKPPIEF